MAPVKNNDKNESQQEINELKQKYDKLFKNIKCIEDNENSIKSTESK